MRYEVGHKIMNPVSKDAAVFAGYDEDGNETWCDVTRTEWGEPALAPPEVKTFEGFDGEWTRWNQTIQQFAEQVSRICPAKG